MPNQAGTGNPHHFKLSTNTDPNAVQLTPNLHYIGIDAVAWYINKQSSWRASRMASGTLQITIAGSEQYQAALGTFELKEGAKFAPVFDRPVLPDRNLIGGPITILANVSAIKKDTVIAGLLKSAAAASLSVVAGMVNTATAAGPAKILSAAGDELIGGVKKVLSDTAQKPEPFFASSGIEVTIKPSDVVGDELYILIHYGAELDKSGLKLKKTGEVMLPHYGGAVLDDGAWLLLRVRRSDEYSGAREWYADAKKLRARIKTVVDDFASDVTSKEDALKEFKPTVAGNSTAFDEFARLRSVIQNDGVLTEREAGVRVADLAARINLAKKSITAGDPALYERGLSELQSDVKAGVKPTGAVAAAFVREFAGVAEARGAAPKKAAIAADQLLSTIRYMPKTVKAISAGTSRGKSSSRKGPRNRTDLLSATKGGLRGR